MTRLQICGVILVSGMIAAATPEGSVRCRHRRFGNVELGYGERIDGNLYSFGKRPVDAFRRGAFRVPVDFVRADTNWTIKAKGTITTTYALAGRIFKRARIAVLPDHVSRGKVVFEASSNGGRDWTSIGEVTNKVLYTTNLPRSLFPAKEIRLRMRGDDNCWGNISWFGFDAEFSGPRMFAFGATEIIDVASGHPIVSFRPWDYLQDASGAALLQPNGMTLWSESSGRKVARGRTLPGRTAESLRIATAGNETEAVQLIVTPDVDVDDVRVSVELPGLPDAVVRVRKVGYVMIDLETDSMGARGRWPDPIFEQSARGCAIPAHDNQPFWVSVKPAKNTKPGVYRGRVEVRWRNGSGGEERHCCIPLEVRVFDFSLPDRMTCETAFGCTMYKAFRYHRPKNSAQEQELTDLYMDVLDEHHISPYNPTPLVAPRLEWVRQVADDPMTWEPRIDWREWDMAMERAFRRWHFNTFSFSIGGKLGYGRKHNRVEPEIAGISITNNPAAYDNLMGKYLGEVQGHLEEKGWLDKAYVYWYDEPTPDDYAFVMRGNDILRRHAPKLRRMLTEEANHELVGGPNLWCPLTGNFQSPALDECRQRGDRFWWYMTFSSKEPLVNEHIEHAGIDNRLWLWQTWQVGVSGILIWEMCHWTDRRTYPERNRHQNPYRDTMGWTGRWKPWTSGEGRYLYPPLSCFTAADAVIEPPVDTIRLEMIREGIEDYEYFTMLKAVDPASSLLCVPKSVMKSLWDYSTDPLPLEEHRLKLAHALEQALGKSKKGNSR